MYWKAWTTRRFGQITFLPHKGDNPWG
jgi:hypothetical protein